MNAQQLKNSILQMAVQGKLVPQDPNDEPASVLLERIRAEKEKLIKEGKIKKEKNPSYIFCGEDNLPYEKVGKNEPVCIADEVPFEIPDSWKWVRLKELVTVLGGKRIPAGRKLTTDNTGHIYIRVSDMKNGSVITDNLLYVPEDIYPSISRYIINKEDLYITVAGTIGAVGKIPPELDGANLTENADRLVFSIIDQDWLMMCLSSSLVQNQIADATTKVGQPKLAIKRIEELIISLPPLNEQRRIVERIKSVTPLLLQYNVKHATICSLNTTFPDALKKSILQQAVMGKLVPQDPEDEPAFVLLERIRAEKQALIKAGKLKKDKHESIIYRRDNSHYEKLDGVERCIDDEIPFELPDSWEWVRFGNIINLQSGQDLTPDKYNDKCKGIPYITGASNIEDATVLINRWTEYGRAFAYRGDLLLTCKGTVGTMAFLNEDQVHIARQIMSIHPYDGINAKYVRIVLETLVEGLKAAAKSMIPGISREDVLTALFPLPPLNEQRRIAEMIDIASDPIGNL